MDFSWISAEARAIHQTFVMVFYAMITTLLLIGVAMEYFKVSLGGVPGFAQLLGRVLIAVLLLVCYDDIANAIASIADDLAQRIGNLNSYRVLLSRAGEALSHYSWSWSSIGDSFIFVISYLGFYLLYITVFFFDAAIAYVWIILYVFSPLLIALYVLPQTSGATVGLFRSLLEVSAWKVVWAVLGALLWSSAVHNFESSGRHPNFVTMLTFTLILALSVLFTPLVVRALISKGISSVASTFTTSAATALMTSVAGPGAMTALATGPTQKTFSGIKRASTAVARRIQNRFRPKDDNTKEYSS